jgi:type VI secretion system secreted protein Hcp
VAKGAGGVAVSDYFLKIDGISGESKDSKHKDEIELVSFSWGLAETGSSRSGGGSASRPQFRDFEFTMKVNKASPQLFLATASGKHLKEATLSVRRAGKAQLEYLKITFTDVLVTSYQQAGADDLPHEVVSLAFDRIDLQYTQQASSGAGGQVVKAGWDLSRNVKI